MREIQVGDLVTGTDMNNAKRVVRIDSLSVDFGWIKSPNKGTRIDNGQKMVVYNNPKPSITTLACI